MDAGGQSEQLRRQLVETLERGGAVSSAPVRDAFLAVPRELFVPEFTARHGIAAVYRDEAILTKRNPHGVPLSSSSQPAIMALMLEQLGLEEGMRVLEVGAGMGYNAALLSVLVGGRGRVVSVDVDPDVARGARRALRAGGYKARVVVADGRDGFAAGAPYDRIVVTASSDDVPVAWRDQLVPGGRVEVPLRLSASGAQAIPVLRRDGDRLRSAGVIAGGFMPLRAAGEDAAAALRYPALVASDGTGEGDVRIRELLGASLRTLSERGRRRLLTVALTDGRRLPLGLRADAGTLTLFLSLTVPERRLVTAMPGFAVGVVARDGASLALLEPRFDRAGDTTHSMRAFGGDEAEALLRGHVGDWAQRGRPAASDLDITVRYDAAGRARIRHRFGRTRARPRPAARGGRR